MNSNYWLDLIAGNVYGANKATALPEKFYLGVSSAHPNKGEATAAEPSGGGYERVELPQLKTDGTGKVTNPSEIRLPKSLTDWGVMTDWVIFDAKEGGHWLCADYFRKVGTDEQITRTCESGTVLIIEAESLKLWFRDDEGSPD